MKQIAILKPATQNHPDYLCFLLDEGDDKKHWRAIPCHDANLQKPDLIAEDIESGTYKIKGDSITITVGKEESKFKFQKLPENMDAYAFYKQVNKNG